MMVGRCGRNGSDYVPGLVHGIRELVAGKNLGLDFSVFIVAKTSLLTLGVVRKRVRANKRRLSRRR